MNNTAVIIKKQLKDTLKNKNILIQFVLFPMMAVIMTKTVKIEGMPDDFFVNLFAVMYVGMAPFVSMTAIISEEKEKNTLRVLMMADVTPWQYLAGIGCYVFCICMLGAAVFCALSGHTAIYDRMLFLLIMAVGILTSGLLGAAVGVGSRNQMSATSVMVPVMMICSFAPMLSMFNETIEKAARFIYSEQMRIMIDALGKGQGYGENMAVVALNMILFGGLFAALYKKRGLA